MKALCVLFFSTCVLSLLGQTIITDSDMPAVSDTYIYSQANPTSVSNPELTGSGYFWDYSLLTSVQQRFDTMLAVGSTPIGYQLFFNNVFLYPDHVASFGVPGSFPNVIPQLSITDVIDYYANDAGSFRRVGFGANINGIPTSVRYTPTDTNYVFPLQYGADYNSTYHFDVEIPSTLYYGQDGIRVDTVDGDGTLETPYGIFNVVRVKSTLNKVDSTYINALSFGTTTPRPEEIEFKWLANGEGLPVLKIITTAGVINSVEYLDSLSPVGILESAYDQTIRVYPNPNNTGELNLDINLTPKDKVFVYDMNGKLVQKSTIVVASNKISLGNLDNGQYVIRILNKDKILFSKFTIIN